MATIILVQRRRRFIARRRIIFQKKSNKIQINYIISGNSLFLNSFHREQIVNFVFLCLKVIFRSFLRWRADRRAVKFFTALCYGFIIRKKQLFKLYLFFLLQRGYNRLMRITDALLLSVLRLTISKHNKKSLPCGFSGNKKRTAKTVLFCCGIDLFSREAALQVFSARMSLTTVFGMGTGGSSS